MLKNDILNLTSQIDRKMPIISQDMGCKEKLTCQKTYHANLPCVVYHKFRHSKILKAMPNIFGVTHAECTLGKLYINNPCLETIFC